MTTAAPESPLWPLREVTVGGLFDARDVTLSLEESVTIVTGENGSGKSTVLLAIHLVATGQWLHLHRLPIRWIDFAFADGTGLHVKREGTTFCIRRASLHFDLQIEPPDAYATGSRSAVYYRSELLRPTAAQRAQMRRRAAVLSDWEPEVPEWLSSLLEQFDTKLISARRLEHRLNPERNDEFGDEPTSVVDRFATEMRDRMRNELSRYAAESQILEKSLPNRIVKAMQTGYPGRSDKLADDVESLRGEVRDRSGALARVGLLNEEEGPVQEFEGYPRDNESILLAVREVYRVADLRLRRLDHLRDELALFASFLNDRLVGKRIELNQRTGIDVVLDSKERIRPGQLSSGEQQLLALAYDLLFETEPTALVLLDEPELSLHVGWLKGLVPAFMDIGRRRRLQYVLATHSPSLIAGHDERERSLDAAW